MARKFITQVSSAEQTLNVLIYIIELERLVYRWHVEINDYAVRLIAKQIGYLGLVFNFEILGIWVYMFLYILPELDF